MLRRALPILLPVVLTLQGLEAQAPAPTAESVAAAVDSIALRLQAEGRIAGISVAVMHEGRIVLARGYGVANLETGEPATDTTMFAIGSVTKQFSTVAALLLVEAGKLSLDAPVAKWFPTLAHASEIRVRDLVAHVSGYPDYYPLDFVDRRMAANTTADRILHDYAMGKLDFEPGTRWSYSNTGYSVLGRIIERVSGMPIGQFLTTRLFRPLGMRHTRFEPAPDAPDVARGYNSWALGPLAPAVPEGHGWTGAAGGIYSTAGDLARWDLALMTGKVVRPESWRFLTTPRRLKNGQSTGYSGGLFLERRDGWLVLEHGGAVSGSVSTNAMVPGSRSAFVVLVNCEDGAAGAQMGRAAFPLLLAGTPPADLAPEDSAATPEPVLAPAVTGPAADQVAAAFFRALQQGTVDRSMLAPEYDFFLSAAKLAGAAERLGPLGEPEKVELLGTTERGGLEVSVTRLRFEGLNLRVLMYRRPDGTIEEFLLLGP